MSVRRLALVAVLLAGLAGTARADTLPPAAGPALPGADVPNTAGAILLPPGWTAGPSAAVVALPYDELQAIWVRAGAAYGIPWQVLAAINRIETNFGGNMGPSSAGAVGWMQFMPDTWLRWGLDADGDGIADPWNAEDAINAAARYLAAAGGAADVARAIFAYNHADWYVRQVLDLAAAYGGGVTPDVSFAEDRRQLEIARAEALVEATREQVDAAVADVERLAAVERGWLARAAGARLLSDELALRRRAGRAGARRAAAEAVLARIRLSLGEAETALEAARSGNVAVPGLESGSYVFPVGGDPALVSVSHTHHDYPAADIAAPLGAPVYALADAVVERAWGTPEGLCGIGAIVDTADGQSWTYCHLSWLDPSVQAGVRLAAGAQIGLVGSTGHSTGPHLHLGLRPTTSYPQDEAWFRSFAGIAFSWQDGLDPSNAPQGSVFAVVETDDGAEAVFTFTR